MIERNRRTVLFGVATLLAIPAFAGVAMAGKHDGHSTEGGGGSSGGAHDDNRTYPPKDEPPKHDLD